MKRRSTDDNPSGVDGPAGRIADWWDRKPVVGWVALLCAVGGAVVAFGHGGERDCATNPLIHVYRPSRLKVVETCAVVTGTVYGYRAEHDGDFHVGMKMDDPSWVNLQNARRQHGLTVVEFVPLMSHPRFHVGQRLRMMGTKVLDLQHGGWVEMHPVFEWKDVTPAGQELKPNQPALAPPTED